LKLSFTVLADGRPTELRVSPSTEDPRLVGAIEAALPGAGG